MILGIQKNKVLPEGKELKLAAQFSQYSTASGLTSTTTNISPQKVFQAIDEESVDEMVKKNLDSINIDELSQNKLFNKKVVLSEIP